MEALAVFGLIALIIQIVHSIEELSTGFHKKWYFMKLSLLFFFSFEIISNIFWTLVVVFNQFPARNILLQSFLILMFANGVQHVVWAGFVKKYVPGLVTATILHRGSRA